MTSLTDVYEGQVRWIASTRRLYLGVSLFLAGAVLVVTAIVVATTTLASGAADLGVYGARELAGALAGFGVLATLLGVFAVLPSRRGTRAAAVIGATVALLGVALFQHAYPYRWLASDGVLVAVTTVVYFFGTMTTFGSLFVAVATFKTRNDPGGTARMEVTREGRVRIVEEARSLTGFGGVGLFGSEPDGGVETQTNRDGTETVDRHDTGHVGSDGATASGTTPASDGGSATTAAQPTDEEYLAAAAARGQPDTYCGNCKHFQYVRSDDRLVPYCGLQAELMDDMEACEEWDGTGR
jgi:hypothetical protein